MPRRNSIIFLHPKSTRRSKWMLITQEKRQGATAPGAPVPVRHQSGKDPGTEHPNFRLEGPSREHPPAAETDGKWEKSCVAGNRHYYREKLQRSSLCTWRTGGKSTEKCFQSAIFTPFQSIFTYFEFSAFKVLQRAKTNSAYD